MQRWKFKVKLVVAATAVAGLASFVPYSHGIEPTGLRVALNTAAQSGGANRAVQAPEHHFVGTSSCTAVSCHGGGPKVGSMWQQSHSLWLQKDKHADAYNVLYNDLSQQMTRLLNLEKPAYESPLCLNCHGPVSEAPYPAELSARDQDLAIDGVSCEACHGAARGWLNAHIRNDWKFKTAEQKATYGFHDTKDLWTRAKLCADCHVGGPGRDVNHDLYAAGHPRLFFELSAFHAIMPAHWDRNNDKAIAANAGSSGGTRVGRSPFEAKLWAIGQTASAEAALDLLIDRIKRSESNSAVPARQYPSAQPVATWPELAETACFACHHNLDAPSWRQQRGYANRKPGAYPWGTWLFPLVPHAAGLAGVEWQAGDGPLGTLTDEMAKPLPDRKVVVDTASALQVRLNGLGQQLNTKLLADQEISAAFNKVAADGASLSAQSWDEATQVYLALVALNRAHREVSGKPFTGTDECLESIPELCKLRKALEFPKGYDSPREYLRGPDANIQDQLNQIRAAFESQ